MKHTANLWCLVNPDNNLIWNTIAQPTFLQSPEEAVWVAGGFLAVADAQPIKWHTQFWDKHAEGIAEAKKLGYSFVRVSLSDEAQNHALKAECFEVLLPTLALLEEAHNLPPAGWEEIARILKHYRSNQDASATDNAGNLQKT